MSTPRDYDSDPERYRLGTALTAAYADADLYALIVDRLLAADAHRVLDVGCGDGVLARRAAGRVAVLGLDGSRTLLAAARAHGPVVRADVTALPCGSGVVDAVVAVHVLDHLTDPRVGLREARRVLRPGGLLLAATTSRADSPELAPQWSPSPTPFDAEDAVAIVAEVFDDVHPEFWDAPLVTLPDRDAVRDYLRARFVAPGAVEDIAAEIAARVRFPLPVTKRGVLVRARR